MHSHPFLLLRPFARDLRTALFTKEDGTITDLQVGAIFGGADVVALRQVHGGRAIVTREGIARSIEADAVASDAPGLALTIRTADCQSFVVYEPRKRVVGLIHAGWRGLLAGIIPSFFDLLWEEWEIRPEEVRIGAGPSLCLQCSGFTDPAREMKGISKEFFHDHNVDLRGIAEDQLWKLGVQEEHLERHPGCTRCANDKLWSYRGTDREAVTKGSTNFLVAMLEHR